MDILNSWAKHAEYLAPHDASPGFVAVVTVPAASTAADKRGSLSYQNRGCCDLPSPLPPLPSTAPSPMSLSVF